MSPLRALSIAALSVAACAQAMPLSHKHPLAPAGEQTKALPPIRGRTIDGAPLDPSATRGRVVVVKFFAKYCEPCKESLPWVEKLAVERTDVLVIGVAEDERESQVRGLANAHGLTFPIIHDVGNALAGRFRVSDMPATFVADPSGRIRWVGGPGQTEAELRAAVSASFR